MDASSSKDCLGQPLGRFLVALWQPRYNQLLCLPTLPRNYTHLNSYTVYSDPLAIRPKPPKDYPLDKILI